MLFSFIGLKPDFMVKIIGSKMEIYDVTSEMGEKIKEMALKGEFEKSQNEYTMPFNDDVSCTIPGLDILKKIIPISKTAMPELFSSKNIFRRVIGICRI
jgi:hypothetical protein